ncbi:MAG: ABC transporter ATP-binding protein [Candidatus Omnitrophica bacterium]|nr:ABC transporter ATP-binding protein [Candidatus Omnitrophota bacterium]
MILVEELKKSYGELRAVDGISFEVLEGELFGFLGPNGAGKTTTLSMISGLLKPDGGRVMINDIDVWQTPKAAKRILGLVPQDVALYEELTARENLRFWGGLYHLSSSELKSNIEKWLDRVGLTDRANDAVSKYSGGMKRRLNLAAGMIHNPQIVLLDEPTVGIDPQARNNILEIIREIAREGVTILFTTHHLEEAETLCNRIAIMDHGKILQTGTVDELAQVVGDGDLVNLHGSFSPAAFKSALTGLSINFINIADGSAKFSLAQNGANISVVIQKLSEAGISIEDLSMEKPSLESVFLKLTGRELRD